MQAGMIDYVLNIASVECMSTEYVFGLVLKQDVKSLSDIGTKSRAISESVDKLGKQALGKRVSDVVPHIDEAEELVCLQIRQVAQSKRGWRNIHKRFRKSQGEFFDSYQNIIHSIHVKEIH